jgi:hypothetical protein
VPDGLPGQGKTNPQFLLGDHVAVYYNNQIYDPPTVSPRT